MAAQIWWRVPLERLASPQDILSLALGVLLALSALVASRMVGSHSASQPILLTISGLFMILAIGEYILDAGPVDIPISLLWLAPGFVLAGWSFGGRNSGRGWFLIGLGFQLLEFGRSVLAALVFGEATMPLSLQWVESASDLLVRALYLVGFVEILVGIRESVLPVSFGTTGVIQAGRDEEAKGSLYRRFHVFLLQQEHTTVGRLVGITISSLGYARYRIAHRGTSFADYYADYVTRRLDRGRGHSTVGKRHRLPNAPFIRYPLIESEEHSDRGLPIFEFLVELGLNPEHVCIDYGCGSLRIGQHLISYLDKGNYWGLDLTDRFYRDGLDLLPRSVAESKKPNLRIISDEALRAAAAASPDFIISYAVLTHVPPVEARMFFDRLMRLMASKTLLVFSFHEAMKGFRRGGKGWAQDAATIERLIRERRPDAQIRYCRRAIKSKGLPQWKTIVEVR